LAAARERLDEILAEGRRKALFYGILLIAMCLAALCSEVYLLTPTMRGFGIAEPLHQFLTASGIVLMGATILKFVYSETRHYYAMTAEVRAKAPNWKIQRVLLPCVAALVLSGFFVLGLFRASEMIFANELDQSSTLAQFVAQHEGLTKAVLVFLTVMLPVAGALALTHGIEIIRAWFEWTRLRYSAWWHNRSIHQTTKALQAKQEQLDKQIAEHRQYGNEVKAEYRDGYNHGKQLGMHKLPAWFYVVKTVAVGLALTFVVFLLDLLLTQHYELPGWRWIFYMVGVLGLTALYGVRQWLARERPSETDIRWKPIWRDEVVQPKLQIPTTSSSNGTQQSLSSLDQNKMGGATAGVHN
jgi:hypothetical protein